jgi:hypothetical protein
MKKEISFTHTHTHTIIPSTHTIALQLHLKNERKLKPFLQSGAEGISVTSCNTFIQNLSIKLTIYWSAGWKCDVAEFRFFGMITHSA